LTRACLGGRGGEELVRSIHSVGRFPRFGIADSCRIFMILWWRGFEIGSRVLDVYFVCSVATGIARSRFGFIEGASLSFLFFSGTTEVSTLLEYMQSGI